MFNYKNTEDVTGYWYSLLKEKKWWILFFIVIVGYLLIGILLKSFVFTEELYYKSLSDQLTQDSINSFFNFQERFEWFGYLYLSVRPIIKIFFTVICISIGAVLHNMHFKIKNIFKAALVGELVFIKAQLIYFIHLLFHLDTLTLETASNYYPLTFLSYFGTQNVVEWLRYPLQTLNLFELIYMIVIAWLLSKRWKKNISESLVIVGPSYTIGLVLWLTFVTFITLQVS